MSPRNLFAGYNLLPSPTLVVSQPNQNGNLSNNPGPPANNSVPEPSRMMPEPSAMPEPSKKSERTPTKDASTTNLSKTSRKAKKAEKIAGKRQVSKLSEKRTTAIVMAAMAVNESVYEKIANAASKRKKTSGDSDEKSKQASKKNLNESSCDVGIRYAESAASQNVRSAQIACKLIVAVTVPNTQMLLSTGRRLPCTFPVH